MGSHRAPRKFPFRTWLVSVITAGATLGGGIYAAQGASRPPLDIAAILQPIEQSAHKLTPPVLPPAPKEQAVRTYTVKAGDSLWKVSEHFCGTGDDWGKIYRASHGISSPSSISPGEVLTIAC